MKLAPWPSNRLALYQAKLLAVRVVAFAFVLIGLLQMLDLLSESEKILAVPSNGNAELLEYVKLRMPQLADTFLPFSVLLGALVTWAGLSTSSEIVVMKGAGMSPHQILWPMMLTALAFGALHFAFAETVLPRTNAALDAWQKTDYRTRVAEPEDARFGEWELSGGDTLFAGRVEGEGEDVVLKDVTVYRRDGAQLVDIISGPMAVRADGGWRLDEAEVFDVERGRSGTVRGF
ncbi:MAG: LptF/LptG family permease, partial [Pacificimonas sp.]